MTAFQKAEALATRRYDRDKLLALVDEVTTHFRMPNSFERSKMRAVCRYLADALDRCSGSTLQQRWNDFEKRFWPKWKAGVDRRGREYWTWGARVLISARMIAPSLDMLSDLRVNQWIAHLPEDHPLAQQHTLLLQATDLITWTSAHSRQLAVSNGLRILLVRGYDSLHHIKDDDLKLLSVRRSKGTDAPGRVDRKGPRVFCLVREEVIADPPIALAFHGSCEIYGELAAAAAMSGASCLACCCS